MTIQLKEENGGKMLVVQGWFQEERENREDESSR